MIVQIDILFPSEPEEVAKAQIYPLQANYYIVSSFPTRSELHEEGELGHASWYPSCLPLGFGLHTGSHGCISQSILSIPTKESAKAKATKDF